MFGGGLQTTADFWVKYFLTDQQGSTVATLGTNGSIIAGSQQRYMPFGEVRKDGGISTTIIQTDFGYTGQRNLKDLGLMDYKARFYDPTIGRFIQPDTIVSNPVDAQTWNRYSYVSNNPINLIDPSGHIGVPPLKCIDDDCGSPGSTPTPDLVDDGDDEGDKDDKDKEDDDSDQPENLLDTALNSYMMGWTNAGTAWSTLQNPNATFLQGMAANYYLGVWVGAHAMLAIGGGMLAYLGIAYVVEAVGGCLAFSPCREKATQTTADIVNKVKITTPWPSAGSGSQIINGINY